MCTVEQASQNFRTLYSETVKINELAMNISEILNRTLFVLFVIAVFLISDDLFEIPSDFGDWFDFDEGLKVNHNKRMR